MAFFRLLSLMFILAAAVMAAAQPAQPTPQPPIIVAEDVFIRASTALQAGDYATAARDYTLVIFLNPTFSQGYYGRALAYISTDDLERALPDLASALATAPNNAEYVTGVLSLRAEVYTQRGEFSQAIADYDAIIQIAPSAQTYAARGLLRANADAPQAALLDLDAAIALAQNEPSLHFYRAAIHARLDNQAASAADLLEFVRLGRTDVIENSPIASGDLTIVELGQGVVHVIPFQAQAGQRLTAAAGAEPGTTTDPVLILLSPDGTPIYADDDSGGGTTALLTNVPLAETGVYVLVVSHSLSGFDGSVGVRIQLAG